MFQRIRKHMTPSTAIAFLALVFALTGGAFAASSNNGGSGAKATASVSPVASAAKAKAAPKGKAGPRGPAGPKGATGAAGLVGPAGSQGPAGAAGGKGENGTNGTNGADGTDGTNGAPGVAGKEGSPWTAGGTLPVGKTEKGTWSVSQSPAAVEKAFSSISFPIPLPAGVAVHLIAPESVPTTECPSHEVKEVFEAEAVAGNLCIYETVSEKLEFGRFWDTETLGEEAGKNGIVISFHAEADGYALGSWAVTAGAA
jgi:hypothetical protein